MITIQANVSFQGFTEADKFSCELQRGSTFLAPPDIQHHDGQSGEGREGRQGILLRVSVRRVAFMFPRCDVFLNMSLSYRPCIRVQRP